MGVRAIEINVNIDIGGAILLPQEEPGRSGLQINNGRPGVCLVGCHGSGL